MWRRLLFEDWQATLAVAGFAAAALVFGAWVVGALLLGRETADRMARMPLDDGGEKTIPHPR